MVISSPSTVTSTPVNTGRASSLEAARATRLTVSRSGAAGSATGSPSVSGKRGKSSAGSVLRWKREADLAVRERAGHLDQQAAGEHDRPGPVELTLEPDLEPELHVGGAQASF